MMQKKKPLEQGIFCPYSKIVENFLDWERDYLLQEYSYISLMRNVKKFAFSQCSLCKIGPVVEREGRKHIFL